MKEGRKAQPSQSVSQTGLWQATTSHHLTLLLSTKKKWEEISLHIKMTMMSWVGWHSYSIPKWRSYKVYWRGKKRERLVWHEMFLTDRKSRWQDTGGSRVYCHQSGHGTCVDLFPPRFGDIALLRFFFTSVVVRVWVVLRALRGPPFRSESFISSSTTCATEKWGAVVSCRVFAGLLSSFSRSKSSRRSRTSTQRGI